MTLQLTAADSAGSSLLALSGGTVQPFSYSPFGATTSRTGASAASVPGFNGERADPLTGVTHLGNGYRAYSPALRRFTSPDSESPFGVGGINPYAYCSNDPVNQRDPSGHGPLLKLIEGIIWGAAKLSKKLALSEAAKDAVLSAVAQTEPVIQGVSAAGSLATGIASAATSNSNPELSAKLGWASLGLGITSAAFGIPDVVGRIRSQSGLIRHGKKLEIGTITRRYGRNTPLEMNQNESMTAEINFRVFGYELDKNDKAVSDSFYIKDINADHEDLIVTHGDAGKYLEVYGPPGYKYGSLSEQEFVDHFKRAGIDLSARKTPLHLVACQSGSRAKLISQGDRLAALLGRPVITYGSGQAVFTRKITALGIFNRTQRLEVFVRTPKFGIEVPARKNFHYPPQ